MEGTAPPPAVSVAAVLLLPPAESALERALRLPGGGPVNAAPTPSGAERAYPLNHTFDASGGPTGTPPANFDFEAAGSDVGSPPTNHTLSAAAQDAGTPPANADFETGDLSGWTVGGTVTVETDAAHGRYARLASTTAALTTSAFTVDAAAQAFVFELGYLRPSGTTGVQVYALTGPTYATSALLDTVTCSTCAGAWATISLDAAPYRGQSVKLRFNRYDDAGIDAVRAQIVFPGWEVSGKFARTVEADGNVFAGFRAGGSLISGAITLDAQAQFLTFQVKGLTTSSGDAYEAYVLPAPASPPRRSC